MAQSVVTLIDKFDLSNPINQADLQDILIFDLTEREREMMNFRLGIDEKPQCTVLEVAALFRTNPDDVISVETKMAKILKDRGIPLKCVEQT